MMECRGDGVIEERGTYQLRELIEEELLDMFAFQLFCAGVRYVMLLSLLSCGAVDVWFKARDQHLLTRTVRALEL